MEVNPPSNTYHQRSRKHGRDWEGVAPESDTGHNCLRVGAVSELFFFFFSDLCLLGLIRADSASIRVDLRRSGLIRPELGHIGRRPKSALNLALTAEIHTSEA